MSRLLNFLVPTIFGNVLLLIVYATLTTAEEGAKMINCYVGPWVNDNRKPKEAFRPEMINASACTHISYAFFGFDKQGNLDSSTTNLDWVKRSTMLRSSNRDLKVIAVVGGPARSSQEFSKLVANEKFRQNLVETCAIFVRSKRINGIDIHWIYPGSDGQKDDKTNFVTLLREMKARLKSYELGISVLGNTDFARSGYDIPEIVKYVDYVNIMAFNYTVNYEHPYHAPLSAYNKYVDDEFSVMDSVYNWHGNGLPYEKLNLGVAFMGHEFIRPDGIDVITYKSYMDLCVKYGHKPQIHLSDGIVYIKIPNGIVSYETTSTLGAKLNFVNQKYMRGVMLWSLGHDDYLGKCGPKFPLLDVVLRKLGGNFECERNKCCRKANLSDCVYD